MLQLTTGGTVMSEQGLAGSVRMYEFTDVRENISDTFTLKGLLEQTDFEDEEVDQIADLEVGQTLSLQDGQLTIRRDS